MAKVLLVTGHSYQDYSVANKEIVKQLTEAIPGVEVDNLAELYPDFKIDIQAEQQRCQRRSFILVFDVSTYDALVGRNLRSRMGLWQHGNSTQR